MSIPPYENPDAHQQKRLDAEWSSRYLEGGHYDRHRTGWMFPPSYGGVVFASQDSEPRFQVPPTLTAAMYRGNVVNDEEDLLADPGQLQSKDLYDSLTQSCLRAKGHTGENMDSKDVYDMADYLECLKDTRSAMGKDHDLISQQILEKLLKPERTGYAEGYTVALDRLLEVLNGNADPAKRSLQESSLNALFPNTLRALDADTLERLKFHIGQLLEKVSEEEIDEYVDALDERSQEMYIRQLSDGPPPTYEFDTYNDAKTARAMALDLFQTTVWENPSLANANGFLGLAEIPIVQQNTKEAPGPGYYVEYRPSTWSRKKTMLKHDPDDSDRREEKWSVESTLRYAWAMRKLSYPASLPLFIDDLLVRSQSKANAALIEWRQTHCSLTMQRLADEDVKLARQVYGNHLECLQQTSGLTEVEGLKGLKGLTEEEEAFKASRSMLAGKFVGDAFYRAILFFEDAESKQQFVQRQASERIPWLENRMFPPRDPTGLHEIFGVPKDVFEQATAQTRTAAHI